MRLQWLIATLIGSIVLLVLDVAALHYDLFWYWRWVDIPLHFFGGIIIGMFAAVVLVQARLWYVPVVLCVLVAWEVFELFANVPQPDNNYLLDTVIDLLCGGGGVILAYFSAQKTLWRSS